MTTYRSKYLVSVHLNERATLTLLVDAYGVAGALVEAGRMAKKLLQDDAQAEGISVREITPNEEDPCTDSPS